MNRRAVRNVIVVIFIGALFGVSFWGIRVYFSRIDYAAREVQNQKEIAYEKKRGELNSKGFYVANLTEDIKPLIESKKIDSLTYEFEGEDFSIDMLIHRNDEGNISFEIERIFSLGYDISARMNMKDVEAIEYRTGNPSQASVLKIVEKYNTEYFVMLKGNYYFLGEDIESLSYKDDHFYYMTYNPEYKLLESATECSKEVKNKIDGFDMKHYYYKYGKINFLSDYYQKLSQKKFTVQNKCDELKVALEEEKTKEE